MNELEEIREALETAKNWSCGECGGPWQNFNYDKAILALSRLEARVAEAPNYDAIRAEINRLHVIMENAPDTEKMGFSCSIGGILNAYREGDISFARAIKEIIKAREAEAPKDARELGAKIVARHLGYIFSDYSTNGNPLDFSAAEIECYVQARIAAARKA